LFHTRRGAIIALCVGILFSLRNFRYLFEHYVPGHTWLTRYHFPPTLFDVILHLCCTVLFTGALLFILRRCRGGERIYLALFVGAAVLAPIGDLPSFASAHVYTWLQAILDLALVPTAVWMFKTLPRNRATVGSSSGE
jgi:hypothetical protein